VNQLIYFDVKPVIGVLIELMFASKNFFFVYSIFKIKLIIVHSGDLDCSDSSDEENCEDNHNGLISLSLHKDYTCMNGYRCAQQRHEVDDYNSLCIPLNELCDGINQCPLGDDEHKWRCRK
jgi:hypothetical protein